MSEQSATPHTPGIAPDGRHYATWAVRARGFFLHCLRALLLTSIAQTFYFSSVVNVENNWAGGPTYQVVETRGPSVMFYLLYAAAVIYWFWNKGYLEGTTGKSLAKRALGYSTVNEDSNEPLGVAHGMLRALFVYIELIAVAICGLGLILWLWPLWDPKRQALLSDRTSRAVVYRD